MAKFELIRTCLKNGRYEGTLTTSGRRVKVPALQITLPDSSLMDVEITRDGKGWALKADLPDFPLTEGVQTYHVRVVGTGEILDSFAVIAGDPATDDLRGDLELLRAELDMLRRAFRAHVVEKGGT